MCEDVSGLGRNVHARGSDVAMSARSNAAPWRENTRNERAAAGATFSIQGGGAMARLYPSSEHPSVERAILARRPLSSAGCNVAAWHSCCCIVPSWLAQGSSGITAASSQEPTAMVAARAVFEAAGA